MKSNWPTKKLGEICEENKKSPFKVEDADNIGEFPFFTSGGKILTHSDYLVEGENIFLSTGGYAHIKYYQGKAAYSADTWALKIKNAWLKEVLLKYVYYQILKKIKFIDRILFRGTGLRHLQKREFLNLEIPIPSLLIQQKIVSILDTIQSAIDLQNKIIETTKELKKSLMADLFRYGGPSFRKNRKLKKTEIDEIPENWEVVRLGKVVKIFDSKRIPLSEKERLNMKGEFPYCGANGIIDYINNYIFDGEYVLLAEDGGYWGRFEQSSYIMKGKFWVNNHAHVLQGMKNKIMNFYLMNILNYLDLSDYISGTTRGKLNQSTMQAIKLPLPPLPEQHEIADILQTVDQKIEIEQKKKALYEELFKTMLNKLMNGEIDVEKIEI